MGDRLGTLGAVGISLFFALFDSVLDLFAPFFLQAILKDPLGQPPKGLNFSGNVSNWLKMAENGTKMAEKLDSKSTEID